MPFDWNYINMDMIEMVVLITAPVTGIVGWIVGKRKRNNDFLHEMQKSINTLVMENARLLDEIVIVKRQNTDALSQNEVLKKKMTFIKMQNEKLQSSMNHLILENGQLRTELKELNSKLDHVESITRISKLP